MQRKKKCLVYTQGVINHSYFKKKSQTFICNLLEVSLLFFSCLKYMFAKKNLNIIQICNFMKLPHNSGMLNF